MSTIKLIYFEECPKWKHVRDVLLNAGIEFEAIDQNKLMTGNSLRSYSSPTILKNGKLIYGEKIASSSSGCSIAVFDEDDIISKIAGAHKG